MSNQSWIIFIGIISLFCTTFVGIYAARSTKGFNEEKTRFEELHDFITDLQNERKYLSDTIRDLQKQVEDLQRENRELKIWAQKLESILGGQAKNLLRE